MRSRNSSNDTGRSILLHDCAIVLKECFVPAVFGLLIFCILLPGSAAALPDTSIFNLEYTHDQLKFSFFAESMLVPIRCAAVLFGGGMGLRIFSFLSDKKKSAFILSLGLTRKKLFLVRSGMGFLAIVFSVGIPVLLSWGLNRAALGGYRYMGASAWNLFFILVLQCTICMLAASAACSIAGTGAEAGVLTATLLGGPTVLLFTLNAFMKSFLWGNVFGASTYALNTVENSLPVRTAIWNPLLFSGGDLERYSRFWRAMDQTYPEPVRWQTAAGWLAAAVLLCVVCTMLFDRRKAENAGMSGLSPLHNVLIRILWPVFGFGLVMEGLRSTGRVPSFLAACAAALLLLAMIDLLFSRNAASLSRRLAAAAVFTLCLFLAAGLVRGGLLGYASRIPGTDRIQSAEVTFPGLPALLTEPASSVTSGNSFYSEARITFTDAESIQLVRQLHQEMIEAGYTECGTADSFKESVFPYDVCFTYALSNGKTMKRYYDRVRLDVLEQFLNLENSGALRRAEGMAVRGESSARLWNSHAFAEGKIYYTEPSMTQVQEIRADEAGREALLQALAADLEKQSVEDRYFPESCSLGMLYFTLNGESDTEQFRTAGSNARIDITPSLEATLSLLAGWGLDLRGEQAGSADWQAEDVESITLQKFDPYASMNRMRRPMSLLFQSYRSASDGDFILAQDFGTRPVLTDPQQIAELLPGLRSSSFMTEGGYLAAVKFRGSDRFTYMFIPSGSAPEFLRTKMG